MGEDDLREGIENNKYVPLVAARAKEEGARYIPICAKTEEDIADYSPCLLYTSGPWQNNF